MIYTYQLFPSWERPVDPFLEIPYEIARQDDRIQCHRIASGIAGTIHCLLCGQDFSRQQWQNAAKALGGKGALKQIQRASVGLPDRFYSLVRLPDEFLPDVYLGQEDYRGKIAIDCVGYLRTRDIWTNSIDAAPDWDPDRDSDWRGFTVQGVVGKALMGVQ